ncbi:hypothetical protein PIB30_075015 [Stylosanthes scabra]|uniref:Uncharacterized protein n=1 Tax=Stylosanthes scabra TaxID=79078 RepID=A0ABU6QQI4_9FABA|nr:hypothetical protein [Stylosanthes scabra]
MVLLRQRQSGLAPGNRWVLYLQGTPMPKSVGVLFQEGVPHIYAVELLLTVSTLHGYNFPSTWFQVGLCIAKSDDSRILSSRKGTCLASR